MRVMQGERHACGARKHLGVPWLFLASAARKKPSKAKLRCEKANPDLGFSWLFRLTCLDRDAKREAPAALVSAEGEGRAPPPSNRRKCSHLSTFVNIGVNISSTSMSTARQHAQPAKGHARRARRRRRRNEGCASGVAAPARTCSRCTCPKSDATRAASPAARRLAGG